MSNINVMRKNLGPVTAYKYAVQQGYTGTEQEFAALMASYATVAQEAESAKDDAVIAKTAAEVAQQAAEAAAEQAEGAIEVDDTLSVEGRAADAKATGDAITGLKEDLQDTTSGINKTIETSLLQIYGKNLFNPLWLNGAGIVNSGDEIYGTSGAFNSLGKIPFVIPAETQYTVSLEAYIEPVDGATSGGFVMQFFRANGTTVSSQIAIPNTTNTWTEFYVTPNLYFGANGFQFAVSAGANNIVHLRNIQIEYGGAVTSYENPLTAYDKKAEAEINETNENLGELSEAFNGFKDGLIEEEHNDILYGETPVWGKFCDVLTGEIKNLSFYSVLGLPIPEGVSTLYPYNANDQTNHALRSVCFYSSTTQDTTTFISGQSGTSLSVANGITIPNNAVTCAVTIGNTNLTEPYYLSKVKGKDEITKYLNNEIYVDSKQVVNLNKQEQVFSVQLPNRKPTFAFIFDDGTDGDINIKALFDSYGFKCGFALIGEQTYLNTRKERYLSYQDDGYEILSHSVNATAFSTVTDLTTAESYLKNSLSVLKSTGFDVKGWVTPSTWLLSDQLPLVEKYYQYGYGHLSGTPETTAYHQFIGLDIRQLDRWGLEGHTIEQTMAKIDEATQNNAYMIFYGHAYPSTENNMTVENMATILTYLKTKSDNGEIMVGTPNETINNYYSFRHSDLLALYNNMS